MKSSIKILVLLTFFSMQAIALAQQFNQKFDTKNHPKSKGVFAQVSYPDGWTAKEAQSPNILQMFTGTHNGVNAQLQFLIRDFGVDIENECSNISEAEWNQGNTDKSLNIVSSNSQKIQFEGKPGFLTDTSRLTSIANTNMTYVAKQMFVCHKKTRLLLTCGNTIPEDNIQKANANLSKIDSICNVYFKSLVLN